jgi:beta-galactosidase
VPGYLYGVDYQRAWFRRSFTVPASLRGKRITLHFGGVKFNSRVYLNGNRVGGCFGGYEPFDVDVTEAVRFDGPNELLVGCHDWTGVFTPGKVEFRQGGNWDTIRGTPRDKILSPIGGLFESYGIWDDVVLRAHPAVYVQDVFIRPSVRRSELAVDFRVANDGPGEAAIELRAVVEDHGKDVLQLPPARLVVGPGKTVSATIRQPWESPPLWSHHDPRLLHLRIELSSGDVRRERFGFREFWTEGDRFFLNGTRVNLLATSWWPPRHAMTRDEIRKHWEAVKRMGCVAFRTHTQPWPSLHYEVADEVGLLVIVEGAVFNDDDAYRIDDPVFWNTRCPSRL